MSQNPKQGRRLTDAIAFYSPRDKELQGFSEANKVKSQKFFIPIPPFNDSQAPLSVIHSTKRKIDPTFSSRFNNESNITDDIGLSKITNRPPPIAQTGPQIITEISNLVPINSSRSVKSIRAFSSLDDNTISSQRLAKETEVNKIYDHMIEFRKLKMRQDSEESAIQRPKEEKMTKTLAMFGNMQKDMTHLLDVKKASHSSKNSQLPDLKPFQREKFTKFVETLNTQATEETLSARKHVLPENNLNPLYETNLRTSRFLDPTASPPIRKHLFNHITSDIRKIIHHTHANPSIDFEKPIRAISTAQGDFPSQIKGISPLRERHNSNFNEDDRKALFYSSMGKFVGDDSNYVQSLRKTLPTSLSTTPSGRQDVFLLGNWLLKTIEGINKDHNIDRNERIKRANEVYNITLSEIVRQISFECMERAELTKKVWKAYLDLTEDIVSELKWKSKGLEDQAAEEYNRLYEMFEMKMRQKEDHYTGITEKLLEMEKKIEQMAKENDLAYKTRDEATSETHKLREQNERLKKHIHHIHAENKDLSYKCEKMRKALTLIDDENDIDQFLKKISLLPNRKDTQTTSEDSDLSNISIVEDKVAFGNVKQKIIKTDEKWTEYEDPYPKFYAEVEVQTNLKLLDEKFEKVIGDMDIINDILLDQDARNRLMMEGELFENLAQEEELSDTEIRKNKLLGKLEKERRRNMQIDGLSDVTSQSGSHSRSQSRKHSTAEISWFEEISTGGTHHKRSKKNKNIEASYDEISAGGTRYRVHKNKTEGNDEISPRGIHHRKSHHDKPLSPRGAHWKYESGDDKGSGVTSRRSSVRSSNEFREEDEDFDSGSHSPKCKDNYKHYKCLAEKGPHHHHIKHKSHKKKGHGYETPKSKFGTSSKGDGSPGDGSPEEASGTDAYETGNEEPDKKRRDDEVDEIIQEDPHEHAEPSPQIERTQRKTMFGKSYTSMKDLKKLERKSDEPLSMSKFRGENLDGNHLVDKPIQLPDPTEQLNKKDDSKESAGEKTKRSTDSRKSAMLKPGSREKSFKLDRTSENFKITKEKPDKLEKANELIVSHEKRIVKFMNMYKVERKKQEELNEVNKELEKVVTADQVIINDLHTVIQKMKVDPHSATEFIETVNKAIDKRAKDLEKINSQKAKATVQVTPQELYSKEDTTEGTLQARKTEGPQFSYRGSLLVSNPLNSKKHLLLEKKNNPGVALVAKIRQNYQLKLSKTKKILPLKALLKQVTAFYNDRINMAKENPLIKGMDFCSFIHKMFINSFGVQKFSMDKFNKFAISVRKHSTVPRVSKFAKMMGLMDDGNYTLEETNQYMAGLDFLLHNTLGIPVVNPDTEKKHFVPWSRANEYIRIFSEKRMRADELQEFRKECEKMKVPDPLQRNLLGLIDIDMFLERVLIKYRVLMNRNLQGYVSAFHAADLDGDGKVSYIEFQAVFKAIEGDKYDEKKAEDIYVDHCDIIEEEELYLSVMKFLALAFEFNLFSEKSQNTYLGIQSELDVNSKYDDFKVKWNKERETVLGQIEDMKLKIPPEIFAMWSNCVETLDKDLKDDTTAMKKGLLIRYKIVTNDIKSNMD